VSKAVGAQGSRWVPPQLDGLDVAWTELPGSVTRIFSHCVGAAGPCSDKQLGGNVTPPGSKIERTSSGTGIPISESVFVCKHMMDAAQGPHPTLSRLCKWWK